MWALLALGLVSIIHFYFIIFREVGPSRLVEHLFISLPLSSHFSSLSLFFSFSFFMSCPSLFEGIERYKTGTLANFQQGSLFFLTGHKVLCHTGDSL
jgi:hypothetical protein